ncbi:MAG: IS1634 family transposase [Verrucomicrobia bacterium]|jgi:transposase|nr:IS1634 family transposase [Verrucomicrobiota bacterium]
MFLKESTRFKDGKEHHYWSLVENRRVDGGRKVVQRHVLYLGEINSSQQAAWRKTIDVFETGSARARTVALFPEERSPAVDDDNIVRIRLDQLELRRPRQWGACWLANVLYQKLGLASFWSERLLTSRKGTRWDHVLQTLVSYRLIDPGSEWRLHREWFDKSAMADLLGADYRLAADDTLYRCLDQLTDHKAALFSHLQERWKDLFNARFDVLLYDLTSTYFESDPPFPEGDKRRFGYSRDKRFDCVQVVIALVVTPEGFPLGYEVLPGNTLDKTTLGSALASIDKQYGKARRVWVMDRGIPTEDTLAQMRRSDPPVSYLVGTPKGRLSQLEAALTELPWQRVREGITVKLLPQEGECYVFAQSESRIDKERAMRRRQLKALWQRLPELRQMRHLKRDDLLMKLGAARQQWPTAWRLVALCIPGKDEDINEQTFTWRLRKAKLRQVRRREGRYLLRTNLTEEDPVKLWEYYIQLTQVEEAFKNLKGDLALRPVYHQKEDRVEAHIFVSFLAYCLHVTLRRWLRDLAPGLTPRAVLEKFAAVQMIDVHLPTTDGRHVILSRYTQPEKELQVLLDQLKLTLPDQPPPRITAGGKLSQ